MQSRMILKLNCHQYAQTKRKLKGFRQSRMLCGLSVCGKVLAAGVASGRISQGLPHAEHTWF